jgi:hypothetical protein
MKSRNPDDDYKGALPLLDVFDVVAIIIVLSAIGTAVYLLA